MSSSSTSKPLEEIEKEAKYTKVERNIGESITNGEHGKMSNSTPADQFEFSSLDLNELRAKQTAFVTEREWTQYHTPRNLLCALVGEVGELAEIFQWKGEQVSIGAQELSARERNNLEDELSDVLLYLVRLSQVCKVDLSTAVVNKIEKNATKYPAHLAKGKWVKYTAYETGNTQENSDVIKETNKQETLGITSPGGDQSDSTKNDT